MRDDSAIRPEMTWRDVLSDWCDPSPAVAPPQAPGPLAEFLASGGRAALSSQNRFQAPVDDNGWSVFYVENQHVCTWAYRTDDPAPDPHVYVRDAQADSPAYVKLECRLDAFLSAAGLTEAVFGAPIWRSGDCPTSRVDDVLGLPPVQLPELGWPTGASTTYYRAPDVLAFAHHQDARAHVFLGARRADALSKIDERLRTDADWNYASWGPDVEEP